MSFDVVLDNISTVQRDVDYITTVLCDHIPNSTGSRPMITIPLIQLEQNERNEIIEKSKSIVTRVSEIDKELVHESWEQVTRMLLEYSQQLYGNALQSNNAQTPNDSSLFQPLGELRKSLDNLETCIKVSDAVNQGKEPKKRYSETQVASQINELEKKSREARLKSYNKL